MIFERLGVGTPLPGCPQNCTWVNYVIPRGSDAPQGGLSCLFGAIHLLGISWYWVPICTFPQEIATPSARNDVVVFPCPHPTSLSKHPTCPV